ncbi:MAG: (2Fe-2S)-binding protein [Thermodesulfobacteriota bacterium]
MRKLEFTVNGEPVSVIVEPGDMLLDVLRRSLGLTGAKEGCGLGECGACTVIVNGRAVNSCITPALEVEDAEVITIEGLTAEDGRLSALQQAFVEHGAIQCGFCTPGMVLSAKALLDENPAPSEKEVRTALAGNLCRCTGYVQIVQAVLAAAARGKED